MTDALSVLEANVKKLASKVERLRNQLAAAETELAESETAIRVLSRLGVSASIEAPGEEAKASSQGQVLKVMPTTSAEAKTPRDVHQLLVASGVTNISAENVRTILSRLRKEEVIQVSDGRYWRTPKDGADDEDDADDDEDGFEYLLGPAAMVTADEDLDSEVPF